MTGRFICECGKRYDENGRCPSCDALKASLRAARAGKDRFAADRAAERKTITREEQTRAGKAVAKFDPAYAKQRARATRNFKHKR
jgi:hypothetical protein